MKASTWVFIFFHHLPFFSIFCCCRRCRLRPIPNVLSSCSISVTYINKFCTQQWGGKWRSRKMWNEGDFEGGKIHHHINFEDTHHITYNQCVHFISCWWMSKKINYLNLHVWWKIWDDLEKPQLTTTLTRSCFMLKQKFLLRNWIKRRKKI